MAAAHLKAPSVKQDFAPGAFWCTGKHGFESAVTAREVALRNRYPMQTYRCERCGLWHVGSAGNSQHGSKKNSAQLIRVE